MFCFRENSKSYIIFDQVTDSKGHILYQKDDAKKGKFAFTTEEYDMFEVCFNNRMPGGRYCVDQAGFLFILNRRKDNTHRA